MNAFMKNLIRIAFIFIGVGIFLVLIAYGKNRSIFDQFATEGYSLFGHNTDWSEAEGEEDGDWDTSDTNEQGTLDGGNLVHPNREDNVTELDVNIIAGTVSIIEGDEFNIQVNSIGAQRVSSEYTNGIWTIEDTSKSNSDDNTISIFGIPLNSESINKNISRIKIFIPKDFNGKKISLKCGAGAITVDSLSADLVSVSVGAGSCRIDKLTAGEKSDFTVGAGEIVINNLTGYNASFDGSMGSIYVKGILKGNISATCSMGTIELNLEGQLKDYNYSGRCNMGTVTVNDSGYTGVSQNFKKDNNADNEININCNMGTVSLKISD